MPKTKTKRAAAKRFKKTGTGKFKYFKSGRRHNLSQKQTSQKRNLRKPGIVITGIKKSIAKLIPYL